MGKIYRNFYQGRSLLAFFIQFAPLYIFTVASVMPLHSPVARWICMGINAFLWLVFIPWAVYRIDLAVDRRGTSQDR
jgi:type VI protein secretion system component VasK